MAFKPLQPRNLVVLMDGTANKYSLTPTNIIKLAQVLQVDHEQLMYYDSGVGTTLPPGGSTWGRFKTWVGYKADEAFAWNFPEHVQGAYRYLMDHYHEGDRIYIFGFSRGSYSARCLAGMIEKVGLLPPGNISQVPLAYKVYTDPTNDEPRTDGAPTLSEGYRKTFGLSKLVNVHFLGVFDTVASLGGADIRELPFASSVGSVSFFRHALALNERRAKFQPVFRHPDVQVQTAADYTQYQGIGGKVKWVLDGIFGKRPAPPPVRDENIAAAGTGGDVSAHPGSGSPKLRSKEVWFMGVHCDCGGGYDTLGANSLSNIPFRWMVREAEQCGLKLDAAGFVDSYALSKVPAVKVRLEEMKILSNPLVLQSLNNTDDDPASLNFTQESQRRQYLREALPSVELHNLIALAAASDGSGNGDKAADFQESCHESLKGGWWIVEYMILQVRKYTGGAGSKHGQDFYSWRVNRGRYRRMLDSHQAIHRSVQNRLRIDAVNAGGKGKWQQPVKLLPAGITWEQLRDETKPAPGGWEE